MGVFCFIGEISPLIIILKSIPSGVEPIWYYSTWHSIFDEALEDRRRPHDAGETDHADTFYLRKRVHWLQTNYAP